MSQNDIIITFLTLIYGLLLTNLFSNFHKLIKAGKKVKWHWLTVLSAWYILLIILKNWWKLYSFQNPDISLNIFYLLAYGHLMLLLFLITSTVLPDVIEEKGIDLKKYYFDNNMYFWGLMIAVVVLSISISTFRSIENISEVSIINLLILFVYLALLILLATSRKYWIHSVLLSLFVVQTIIEIIEIYKKDLLP